MADPKEEKHDIPTGSEKKSIIFNKLIILLRQAGGQFHDYCFKMGTVEIDGIDNTDPANPRQKTIKTLPQMIYDFTAEITGYLAIAKSSEDKAKVSEDNAKVSEDAAKISETNAKGSEVKSKASEDAAKISETNAKGSEVKAKASEDAAGESEDNIKVSEDNAKISELAAKESEKQVKDAILVFNYTYWGSQSTDPTGSEVNEADIYYNNVTEKMKYYGVVSRDPKVLGWVNMEEVNVDLSSYIHIKELEPIDNIQFLLFYNQMIGEFEKEGIDMVKQHVE